VSQPGNRGCRIEAPGKLDKDLGEFWSVNPWQIAADGHNLSAFERDRVFLNVGGKAFLEISYLTGADNEGDGRGVVAADFFNTGRLDLLLRQVGGGPLVLYENRFPQRHYLEVTLRGRKGKSNRQGVGARLEAVAGGLRQVREMYPTCGTMTSQGPNRAHFGLGDAAVVERLTVRWPSGRVQELRDIRADRHVVIDEDREGDAAIETVVPGHAVRP
jgi:hypothetical protein